MTAPALSEAFCAIVMLAKHDGVKAINELPGCWHRQFGAWAIWVNGHQVSTPGGPRGTVPVEPFETYIEFNGWPAGIVTATGGVIAGGSVANEDSFIAAIEAEIGRLDALARDEVSPFI